MSERESTAIIAERMFAGEQQSITLDRVLGALTVYYWWTDELQEPQHYIINLIRDAGRERLPEFTDMLHSELAICGIAVNSQTCEMTGSECFNDYLSDCANDMSELSEEDLYDNFEFWAELLMVDSDESEGRRTLRQAYERYVTDRLSECGATDLEIGNALQVLQIEAFRRLYCRAESYQLYLPFKRAGGSFEDFASSTLPELLLQEDYFAALAGEYEDLPAADASQLDADAKRALVMRQIQENIDRYQLMEISYLKYEEGILPPYLYRFSD